MQSDKKRVILIDGSNLIFRAFHSVPPDLATSTGIPTNAVYGVLKLFRGLVNELVPDFVVVVWDAGKKTFRHQEDPLYKAHRPPTDDRLKKQFSIVKEALDILKVPQITPHTDYECDDMIGTLATRVSDAGLEAIIVSSDKDFFQLASQTIKIYNPHRVKKQRGLLIDDKYVCAEYGVTPQQTVDVKALTGERTDGIVGVKGIGDKTAQKLIQTYGSLENLLVQGKKSTDKAVLKVLAEKEVAIRAFFLATIKTDIDIPVDSQWPPVEYIKVDKAELVDFFERYEMQSFLFDVSSWLSLYSYKKSVA